MTKKAQRSVHIKWIRSGIGFTRWQKEMVRSLGLRRLNQVVERPDTPQIRGLVANIPHLVEIVSKPAKPAWLSVPEYTILPPVAAPDQAKRRAQAKPAEHEKVAVPAEAGERAAKEVKAQPEKVAAAEHATKGKKPAKGAAVGKAKAAKAAEDKKTKAAGKSAKPSKKTKK